MIISGKQLQGIMQLYKEQNTTVSKPERQNKTALMKPDEVILSSKGQEFSQIYQNLKAMPEVRQDKVAELSAQVTAGTYKVPAKDIAEKNVGQNRRRSSAVIKRRLPTYVGKTTCRIDRHAGNLSTGIGLEPP